MHILKITHFKITYPNRNTCQKKLQIKAKDCVRQLKELNSMQPLLSSWHMYRRKPNTLLSDIKDIRPESPILAIDATSLPRTQFSFHTNQSLYSHIDPNHP